MQLFSHLAKALRLWTRRPVLGVLAVLPLALAIGALTALFTVVNVSLLRPLPGIGAPAGLLEVGRVSAGFGTLSYPDFQDLEAQAQSLSAVYAYAFSPLAVRPEGAATASNSFGLLVSADYFGALQVRAHAGRLLDAADMRPGSDAPAAVLSYSSWQRLYGADPAVIGRPITINGSGFVIVGIAAPEFRGHIAGISPDFYLPVTQVALLRPGDAGLIDNRLGSWLLTGARIAEGYTLAQVQAELATIGERLVSQRAEQDDSVRADLTLSASPLRPLPRDAMRGLLIFVGVLATLVSTLLLVACINVAGLALARAEERRSELAVHLSLGASRPQLLSLLLSETLILALLATVLGVLLSWLGLRLLLAVPLPIPLPLHFDITPDARVLAFGALLTLLTALACGLLPAWRAARSRLAGELQRFRSQRAQQLLSVLQVATTLVLVVAGAGVLRATQADQISNPGIEVERVLTFDFDLGTSGYDSTRALPVAATLLDAARQLPGVEQAALAAVVPLTLSSMSLGSVEGEGLPPEGLYPDANVVTPGFAATLGIALRGRDFSDGDRSDTPAVVIINRHLATQIFGSADPIGRSFVYGDGDNRRSLQVVGVIEDSHVSAIGEAQRGYLLLPLSQWPRVGLNLLLRTELTPAAAASAVHRLLQQVDANLPPPQVFRLADQAAIALLPQRIASVVINGLGALGLLLVGLGLYGLLLQFVHARWREIGVRQALGAAPTQIAREVCWRGLKLVLIGLTLAIVPALLALRLVSSLFVGVDPWDLSALVGAILAMLLLALLTAIGPARQAARTAPAVALRHA
ncbi:MAG: ADOP family duplicated permease [Lysobacterales bacterium]